MPGGIFRDPTIVFDQRAPARVVSLVPSTTGSLIDLGLGHVVVGCTDFCELPEGFEGQVTRTGGPKTPNVEKILALNPDLIIVNQEENAREPVEALAAAGAAVWMAFPLTVKEAVRDLWTIANLFRSPSALRQVDLLERGLEWAAHAAEDQPKMRYFCPIWQAKTENGTPWWMTFNQHTYSHDVLSIFQGENVFAERERRYPLAADLSLADSEAAGERDTRYPRVTVEEIVAARPEIILLPGEPYSYGQAEAAELMITLAETPAAKAGRLYTLDGSLITWTGTRLARALEEIPLLFNV